VYSEIGLRIFGKAVGAMSLVTNTLYLSRSRISEFLNTPDGEKVDAAGMTVYLPPLVSKKEAIDLLQTMPDQFPLIDVLELAGHSRTGSIILWGSRYHCMILPPFPSDEKAIFPGYHTDSLLKLLANEFLFGVVLVHLGSYAVAVCRGEAVISSKLGTGVVHGRQRQGGSSSKRYLRRRENQVTEFLEKVAAHIAEQFTPFEREIDYLFYGGPHQTVLQLKKECPLLHKFEDRILRELDVPEVRLPVLEATIKRIWSSRIIEWCEV